MSGYNLKTRQFTEACQDNLPVVPTRMSPRNKAFIIEMIKDEIEELEVADTVTDEADALIDIIYYICDAATRQGIDLDPIFNIVHEANMRKVVNGKVIKREDGKIIKPAGWFPPEPLIEKEIERQMRNE